MLLHTLTALGNCIALRRYLYNRLVSKWFVHDFMMSLFKLEKDENEHQSS